MAANDKSMAGTVKTRDGTVDDPFVVRDYTSDCLDRTSHTNPNHPLTERRNSSETMTYLTLVAIMMFVLSPVLIPLVITGVHAIRNLRPA
jgi:hypothetical protein